MSTQFQFSVSNLFIFTIILWFGALLFSHGFFPQSSHYADKSTSFETSDEFDSQNRKFQKLIFVVVDALRQDFVYENVTSMPFTHK